MNPIAAVLTQMRHAVIDTGAADGRRRDRRRLRNCSSRSASW